MLSFSNPCPCTPRLWTDSFYGCFYWVERSKFRTMLSLLSFKSKLRSRTRTRSAIQPASLLGFWHSANEPLEADWFWQSLPIRYRALQNPSKLRFYLFGVPSHLHVPDFSAVTEPTEVTTLRNPVFLCIYGSSAKMLAGPPLKFTWVLKVGLAHT